MKILLDGSGFRLLIYSLKKNPRKNLLGKHLEDKEFHDIQSHLILKCLFTDYPKYNSKISRWNGEMRGSQCRWQE